MNKSQPHPHSDFTVFCLKLDLPSNLQEARINNDIHGLAGGITCKSKVSQKFLALLDAISQSLYCGAEKEAGRCKQYKIATMS